MTPFHPNEQEQTAAGCSFIIWGAILFFVLGVGVGVWVSP